MKNVPDVLFDLLEIASYVYSADAVVSRGGKTDAQMGASWRRKYRFVIPVRQPDLWSSDTVLAALTETLSFVSEDAYELEFRPLQHPPAIETYFEFPDAEETGFTPDEVICFRAGWIRLQGRSNNWLSMAKRLRSLAIGRRARL